jgi:hypothetical protein
MTEGAGGVGERRGRRKSDRAVAVLFDLLILLGEHIIQRWLKPKTP